MIEPDASERESVATAHEPDASDAFDAAASTAEHVSDGALDSPESAPSPAISGMQVRRARPRAVSGARGGIALLDSLSPLHPDAHQHTDRALDAFDQRVPCEVFRAVWTMLDTCRDTALELVMLTLTTAGGEGISEAAAHFAADVAHDDGAGVLLALDSGARAAHLHFHGVCLTRERPALTDRWRKLAGAEAHLTRVDPVTGWKPLTADDRERSFARNLSTVLWYAFKPWPAARGRRSLDTDVIASGIFTAPWQSAKATLDTLRTLGAARPGKASRKRLSCLWCGGSMPSRKRTHADWCSGRCRRAASARRCAERKATGQNDIDRVPDGAA